MGRGSRPQLLWLAALSALITVGISVIVPAASGELPASTPPPWRSVSASEGADRIERLAKGHPKLESVLSQLAAAQREGGLAQAARLARSQGLTLKGDAVRVVVEARSGKVASAVRAVEAQGGRVETTYKDLVQALVPLPALEPLADLEAVRWVRRPWQPQPAVVSEGVGIINAPAWQVAGYRGQGVKVAILDGGFQGYAALQGTELPSNPVTQSFTADGCIACGTPHGTACAEIVYDIAPHAQYYFVTAHTDVEFGNAVSYLVDQEGVDIVSHSANWSVAGPGDGSGYLADLINHAQSQGVLWVNSAGNFADMHWEGAWRDDNGNDLHDWIPGDEGQTIYLEAGEEIQVGLRWDDPWGASGNDYDLLLCTGGCDGDDLKACGCDTQNGDDDPVEFISYRATESGNYWIAVEKYRANRNVHFEIYSYYHPLEYPIASSSLGIPADAAGALAVGAIHWNSLGLEPFSSQGPTNDGRTKPDLVAPDGVSTQSYGPSDGRPWASRGTGFFGTSASAPHVAGAAALVKSAYPSYGPAQIRNLLEGRAIDMGSGGQDNLYGWGRLTLGQAPTGTATPTPTVTRTPGPPTATPGAFKNQLPLIMKVWPPIPDVPVLHEISNPDGDGNYTVSWGAAARATSYTLEEDDNALFSSPTVVYSGVETSTVITGKAMGTYYYRVRATNSYGHSAWSAPQAVTVMPPTPTPTQTPTPSWTIITTQDFEGSFPSSGWQVVDQSDEDGGEYAWGRRDCRAHNGSRSAWSVGGGADGRRRSCGQGYRDNMDTWMTYGPFDLRGAWAAELVFYFWNESEEDYDELFWGASVNDIYYYGEFRSGNWTEWEPVTFDLANWLGESQVWIGFSFWSDDTVVEGEGAFVDDVILRKATGGQAVAPGERATDSALVAGDRQALRHGWRRKPGR